MDTITYLRGRVTELNARLAANKAIENQLIGGLAEIEFMLSQCEADDSEEADQLREKEAIIRAISDYAPESAGDAAARE